MVALALCASGLRRLRAASSGLQRALRGCRAGPGPFGGTCSVGASLAEERDRRPAAAALPGPEGEREAQEAARRPVAVHGILCEKRVQWGARCCRVRLDGGQLVWLEEAYVRPLGSEEECARLPPRRRNVFKQWCEKSSQQEPVLSEEAPADTSTASAKADVAPDTCELGVQKLQGKELRVVVRPYRPHCTPQGRPCAARLAIKCNRDDTRVLRDITHGLDRATAWGDPGGTTCVGGARSPSCEPRAGPSARGNPGGSAQRACPSTEGPLERPSTQGNLGSTPRACSPCGESLASRSYRWRRPAAVKPQRQVEHFDIHSDDSEVGPKSTSAAGEEVIPVWKLVGWRPAVLEDLYHGRRVMHFMPGWPSNHVKSKIREGTIEIYNGGFPGWAFRGDDGCTHGAHVVALHVRIVDS